MPWRHLASSRLSARGERTGDTAGHRLQAPGGDDSPVARRARPLGCALSSHDLAVGEATRRERPQGGPSRMEVVGGHDDS